MVAKRKIIRADIMPMTAYAEVRESRRASVAEIKKHRRVEVGPFATFYFENYDTMWHQVHEMLFIEQGGEAQIAGELDAYNPLIPKGRELVATLMFEIDDPGRRERLLGLLGGVEHTVSLRLDDEAIDAAPTGDIERSTPEGRASSVHFLRFPFTDAQVAKFRDSACRVVLGIGHAEYGHSAVLPDAVRRALSDDFD